MDGGARGKQTSVLARVLMLMNRYVEYLKTKVIFGVDKCL